MTSLRRESRDEIFSLLTIAYGSKVTRINFRLHYGGKEGEGLGSRLGLTRQLECERGRK